jgi:hypothetical protein
MPFEDPQRKATGCFLSQTKLQIQATKIMIGWKKTCSPAAYSTCLPQPTGPFSRYRFTERDAISSWDKACKISLGPLGGLGCLI